jgi:hypothetical protein
MSCPTEDADRNNFQSFIILNNKKDKKMNGRTLNFDQPSRDQLNKNVISANTGFRNLKFDIKNKTLTDVYEQQCIISGNLQLQ